MQVQNHALLSLIVGAIGAFTLPLDPVAAFSVALAAGVGIDFDHFALAVILDRRLDTILHCASTPIEALKNQGEIFSNSAVNGYNRLVSHLVIISTVPAFVYLNVSEPLGILVGASIGVHIAADIVVTATNGP